MSDRMFNWICNIYVLMVLITFGYSFNADFRKSPPLVVNGIQRDRSAIDALDNGTLALLKGVAWPVYWSVVAFEYKRPK